MDELIDVLDANGNKTGEVCSKKEIKEKGLFHSAIAVCIVNQDNDILLQKRSESKKAFPNMWSMFVTGHVISGENPKQAAVREIYEEIGLKLKERDLDLLYIIKSERKTAENYYENIFFNTYIVHKKIDINKLKIQNEELSEIKFISIFELKKLIKEKSNMLVPNGIHFKKIFPILEERLKI